MSHTKNLIQFIQIGPFSLYAIADSGATLSCEYLEISHIDRDFSLTIAHGNVWSCHSERSEESQIVSAGNPKQ
jgi:hypothetical protein